MISSKSDNLYRNGNQENISKLLLKLYKCSIAQLQEYFFKVKIDRQMEFEPSNIESSWINDNDFLNAIKTMFDTSSYECEALKLFKMIDFDNVGLISWEQFLEYLITFQEKICYLSDKFLSMKKSDIFIKDIDHCMKEPISVIITIETDVYFCYVIISRHGKVGIYDGKFKLLLEYDVFFIRTGINKRIRNIYITASVYLSDMKLLLITASDKSMMIYEASTLCHTPLFLITGMACFPTCLSYKSSNAQLNKSYLVIGDDLGGLTTVVLKQPKVGMFYKENPDKVTCYFWIELQNSLNEPFCKIKMNRRVHSQPIKKVEHILKNNSTITCSSEYDASVIIQHNKGIMEPYIFKVPKGVTCFHYSEILNLLATGGADSRLRLWEPVVTVHPSVIFPIQHVKIVDVTILAHINAVITFNKNGVLKIWDIFSHECIQSINIRFPSFGVLGRPIKFGFASIYYGPARIHHNKLNMRTIDSLDCEELLKNNEYEKWARPEIIITCCNHIAIIPMNDRSILSANVMTEKDSDDPFLLLPPPEKNRQPRRPSLWENNIDSIKANELNISHLENIFDMQDNQIKNYIVEDIQNYKKIDEFTSLEELLQRTGLNGLLKKCFLSEAGQKHNINIKLLMHQAKKEKMRLCISQGAPFTALDLQVHNDVKFSMPLPLSMRMQKKTGLEYFSNPQEILRHNSCFSMCTPKSNYTSTTSSSNTIDKDNLK